VDEACVHRVVQHHPGQQWLLVGGWPCQDLSNAGQAQGMQGQRAQLLHDVVRIVKSLQRYCALPPAYLIENVNFQHHRKEHIASDDFAVVCSLIGQPIMFDAAQCGSLAHRVRNYWTNLCCVKRIAAAFEHVQRPPGRTVALALQPGRSAQPVVSRDRAPQYNCNQPGEPRAAWPTLMSRPQSYAFRQGQPGSVWDHSNPAAAFWDEPSAQEREIALGYEPGSTAAVGVSEQQRRSALGQCIDANALQVLMAICQAWWFDEGSFALPADASVGSIAASAVVGADEVVGDCSRVFYTNLHVSCIAAAAQEALAAGTGSGEIWADHLVLTALQQGTLPSDATPAERKRVQRRLKLYAWDQQHQQLNRIMPDGTYKIVPKPADRLALVQQQHEQCGHFGIKRTASLLLGKYWWHGLLADVSRVIGKCQHCDRVRATFSDKQEDLQSIPISSLGFRWHIDLAGPLPISKHGSRFVMVAIEAFSKYLVAVPLPDKTPETVALAFLQHVLSRFAAPGQVVSDNGSEFTQGAFKQLLLDCLIDHNLTSVCHPRANGQAEKAVHIVKRALSTMAIQKHAADDWDRDVAFLMLGYNCSTHSSTGYSPYQLMHVRQPIAPPAIRSSMAQPIDYEDESAAAEDLQQLGSVGCSSTCQKL
jgi:transposase InsO family protein